MMAVDDVSVARTIEDWNPALVRLAADHEAAHASAAHHFGWRVEWIELREDGGDCFFTPPEALDWALSERQRCVILLAAPAFAGERGALCDRIDAFWRARAITRCREEQELLRRRCEYEAIQLVAMPAFRSQVERIAKALIENGGKLQARDLTSLLAEPRRLRPRVAWPPPEQWTNEMLDEHEQHVREHFPDEWEAWQAELNDGAHEGGTPGSEASPAAGPTASRG